MLSSTSNSEAIKVRPVLTRATWALLLCAVLVYAGAEGAAQFGLQRISGIHQRIMGQWQAALALQPASPGQPQTILFAGNSLLNAGLNIEVLETELRGRYRPQRLIVEATNYYDWYYALRCLFHKGMRPDVVVVALHAAQFTTNTIRGDFSARFLFDLEDLWPMSRDTGADLTRTSSYYAAHFSTFYAARSELRGVLMGKLSPPVMTLWQHVIFSQAVLAPDEKLEPVMQQRLIAFDQLCRQYGAHFIFLIPLTFGRGDTVIMDAGKKAGVQVLRALPNDSLPPDFFQEDTFHLNEKGALVWTRAIAKELLQHQN
jgi:hypothetical protein